MLIEERFRVKAPIQKVWDFLLDPRRVAACVPGCQSMEKLDDHHFFSVVKVTVGPISATFRFKTAFVETHPPKFFRTVAEGADVAGRFKQESTITLEEISPVETGVSYKSQVRVVGKLAVFGDRVMRAKAKEMGEKFAQAVKSSLESSPVP